MTLRVKCRALGAAAAVLDKLDVLDQAREALPGRFPGWEALRKFFL